jgi:uncharacterized phage protein (TIGR01671 family)
MREIKFRAYSPSENKMYEFDLGSYMRTNECGQEDLCSSEAAMNGLMQFTGLRDKNKKDIYEGDILKRSKEGNPTFLAIIEFNKGSFGGATIPHRNHWILMSRLCTCDYDGGGYDEIIGNIYENPELLKP